MAKYLKINGKVSKHKQPSIFRCFLRVCPVCEKIMRNGIPNMTCHSTEVVLTFQRGYTSLAK